MDERRVIRLDELTPAQASLVLALIEAMRERPKHDAPERLLSVPEAALRLGIGRSRLYTELGTGAVKSIKIGRRRLIPESEITRRSR